MIAEPLRVALFHKDFEPHSGGGGTARHIHGLASALADNGCAVRVAAPNPETVTTPYATFPIDSPGDMEAHAEWADVVHVHGARSVMAFQGARLARRLGKPFFYTPHCWYKPRSLVNAVTKLVWDQTAERYMLTHCANTIVLTDFWQDYLRHRLMPSSRTIVIPNCVLQRDLKIAARKAPLERAGPVILSVGRLSPEKRGRDVIMALAEPALQNATLNIAGKGPDRPALEALAESLGVTGRVNFLGFVTDDDLAELAAASDVFVLASEEEGLPTILLEMILAKIPIVCTRIPGNLAITNIAGIAATYNIGDVSRLATLLANPEPINESVLAAVEDNFTWEKVAPKILESYRTALAHARAA
jgi:glycosyltransferase involved in cell wall biosynthesis